jgi:chromosome segregation ATPase
VSEDVDKLRSQAGDVQELRGVLETARSQLVECQRDRDKWKGECDSLQDAVDMFQTSKETLQKELKRVTDLYEASESDLSSARRKLSESSQEVKDLQQLKTETIDLQSVLSMLREVNSRIDAELVEKNKTIVNSTLFIGELKAEVAMLSVESEGHQKGMVRVTAELVEARSLLDKYREINDWIEREMCKSPDSISYATTREYIEQLIEAKNHSTALLLENSQLLEALSSSGHSHIVLEVEDALCQTEDEITNEVRTDVCGTNILLRCTAYSRRYKRS